MVAAYEPGLAGVGGFSLNQKITQISGNILIKNSASNKAMN